MTFRAFAKDQRQAVHASSVQPSSSSPVHFRAMSPCFPVFIQCKYRRLAVDASNLHFRMETAQPFFQVRDVHIGVFDPRPLQASGFQPGLDCI